jgi:hypothetical protein
MNVFMVFRLVLGIIASFFILYVLINFSGIYSEMQGHTQCMMVINNFIKAAEDVQLTGNSIVYEDFEGKDCDIVFDGEISPPLIRSIAGQQVNRIPMIYLPGDELLIEKRSMDFGWWKFDFIEALPELTIIFNPLDATMETKDEIRSIAGLFPDTSNQPVKIRFGFCDGSTLEKPCRSGQDYCDVHSFMTYIDSLTAKTKCSLRLGDNQRLVTIHSDCPVGLVDQGVCISPKGASGYGNMAINQSVELYYHKNPLDRLAMIVGGDETTNYGSVAENLFIYENRIWRQELDLMSLIHWHRSSLISQNLPNQPLGYDENSQCRNLYTNFALELDNIRSVISNNDYYKDTASLTSLLQYLNYADSIYQDMLGMGCIYRVE